MDDQFGCANTWLDPRTRWPAEPGFPRARIGRTQAHEPVVLDLRPHVLITGSPGKTALFRTVLAGLADGFSPDAVQFLLADLRPSRELLPVPHVATSATGLAADPGLARLLVRALDDELWRRNNLAEPELDAEPALVVAIDDADQVVAAVPGLLDVLAEVYREGFRLRTHLLLTASDPAGLGAGHRVALHREHGELDGFRFLVEAIDPQQLGEFVASFHLYQHPTRSLWEPPTGLTYDRLLRHARPRNGEILLGVRNNGHLRTLRLDFADRSHVVLTGPSEEDNRAVLHTVLRRVAERYGRAGAVVVPAGQADRVRAVLSGRLAQRASWTGPEVFVVAHRGDSLRPVADLLRHGASIGVHLIAGDGAFADAVPAEDRLELRTGPGGQVAFRAGPERGTAQIALDVSEPVGAVGSVDDLTVPDNRVARDLRVPVGRAHGTEPVHLDLRQHTWCGGHSRSGKSTLLERIAVSVATRFPAETAQLLIAEFGGHRLTALAGLPNTTGYVAVDDAPAARRFCDLLDDEIRRRLSASGALPRLVVLADEPQSFPAVGETLRRVVALGGGLGVSLVLTDRHPVGQDQNFAAIYQAAGNRIGLKAANDDELARTLELPAAPPMTGAYREGHLRVGDGEPQYLVVTEVFPAELREVVFRAHGPAVRALPVSPPPGAFTYDELRHLADAGNGLPLGLHGDRPLYVDFERHQHFLVLGEPRTGRSTVLRTLLRGIARRYTAEECAVSLAGDGDLQGVIPDEYLGDARGRKLFAVIDDLPAGGQDPLPAAEHLIIAGTSGIVMRPDVNALDAPRLFLGETRLAPGLPEVGHGELMPWRLDVQLPWHGPVPLSSARWGR